MQAREEVTVAVERDADRRVTKLFLDLFGVGSLRYEQRGACVAQVVETVERSVPLLTVLCLTEAQARVEPELTSAGRK